MNIKSMIIAIVIGTTVCSYAKINFGSRDAALVVSDTGTFQVDQDRTLTIQDGSFVNTGGGLVKGPAMKFDNGRYSFYHSVSDLNGKLVPGGDSIYYAGTITLGTNLLTSGDTMIANPGGLQGARINVLLGANILRGQPLFLGSQDLTFLNSSAFLAVAIQNTLDTNIILNGGSLYLQDDLRLGSNAVILDSGVVGFNARRLILGGKGSVWNGAVEWVGPNLQLNGEVTLNGIWGFVASDDPATRGDGLVDGNGTIVDLSDGGTIWILKDVYGNPSDISFSNMVIKGLGSGTLKLDPGCTLRLSNVTLVMDSDYTFDSGTVIIEGDSTVITKDFILSFGTSTDGSVGKLIVDRVTLTYDTQASIDKYNIQPIVINDPNRVHVDVLGEGQIVSINTNIAAFQNYSPKSAVKRYVMVGPERKFVVAPVFTNPDPYQVIVDGNSYFMGFTITDQQVFTIAENVHATTSNITMRDFSPKHVEFLAGSSLTFGDNTLITFARNETLNYPWYFKDKVTIRGGGLILELGSSGALVVGPNCTLTLDSVILKGINGTKIRCTDNTSKIILKNVKWIQDDDASYAQGGIDILDDVMMVGPYNLTYSSPQPLRILSFSTLTWNRWFSFTYASAARNLFAFIDDTSTLMMDESSLVANTNLTLATGLLMVRDQNYLGNAGAVTFDPSLTRDQPAGATLEAY